MREHVRKAIAEARRVLALPYWPRDRIPPTLEFLFATADHRTPKPAADRSVAFGAMAVIVGKPSSSE